MFLCEYSLNLRIHCFFVVSIITNYIIHFIFRLFVQWHVLSHDGSDFRIHVGPQPVLVKSIASCSHDQHYCKNDEEHRHGTCSFTTTSTRDFIDTRVCGFVVSPTVALALVTPLQVLALHATAFTYCVALVQIGAAALAELAISCPSLGAGAVVGRHVASVNPLHAQGLECANLVHAGGHFFIMPTVKVVLAGVLNSFTLKPWLQVDAHTAVAVTCGELQRSPSTLVFIFTRPLLARSIHERGGSSGALAFISAVLLLAHGLPVCKISLTSNVPRIALSALIFAHFWVDANVRHLVLLEASTNCVQHRSLLKLASIVALVDDDRGVDGHVSSLPVSHLLFLLKV
mmetsp:Transcript_19009/g.26327  ORF Transcript_19009/g.26327 Transcript_19009/m.26327 type:complete len:344 (+) Transcript_19009:168-1199(+)